MTDPAARRSFVRVLTPGVLAAALGAVASAKQWAALGANAGTVLPFTGSSAAALAPDSAGQVPLASALSLVALAAWGALLVTRGRARQVFAGLGALSSVGLVVTAIRALWSAPHAVRQAVTSEFGASTGHLDVSLTGWFWVALAMALITACSFVAAVRLAPGWPAMGAKYDAPTAAPAPEEPRTNQEIWKALDEGHDPTA